MFLLVPRSAGRTQCCLTGPMEGERSCPLEPKQTSLTCPLETWEITQPPNKAMAPRWTHQKGILLRSILTPRSPDLAEADKTLQPAHALPCFVSAGRSGHLHRLLRSVGMPVTFPCVYPSICSYCPRPETLSRGLTPSSPWWGGKDFHLRVVG